MSIEDFFTSIFSKEPVPGDWILLETKSEIKQQIAKMDMLSKLTAQHYANFLYQGFSDPNIKNNIRSAEELEEKMELGLLLAFAGAIEDTGQEPREGPEEYLRQNKNDICLVAASITEFTLNQEAQKKKMGWVKKAAWVAGGLVIASFFG